MSVHHAPPGTECFRKEGLFEQLDQISLIPWELFELALGPVCGSLADFNAFSASVLRIRHAGADSQLIRMADVVSAVVSLDFSVAAVSSVPLSTFTELDN